MVVGWASTISSKLLEIAQVVSVDAARGADAHSFMAFRGNDAAKQIKLKSKFAGAEADVEVSGAQNVPKQIVCLNERRASSHIGIGIREGFDQAALI